MDNLNSWSSSGWDKWKPEEVPEWWEVVYVVYIHVSGSTIRPQWSTLFSSGTCSKMGDVCLNHGKSQLSSVTTTAYAISVAIDDVTTFHVIVIASAFAVFYKADFDVAASWSPTAGEINISPIPPTHRHWKQGDQLKIWLVMQKDDLEPMIGSTAYDLRRWRRDLLSPEIAWVHDRQAWTVALWGVVNAIDSAEASPVWMKGNKWASE